MRRMSVCWCNVSKDFSERFPASRRSAPSRSPFPRHLSVPALGRPFLPPELSVVAVLLTKGSRAQSPLFYALLPHRPHTITPYQHRASKHSTLHSAALICSAALCERPHSASASNPHERRSVATTQNTLPRSYLRLHVAARNSSQRNPPHQLTCVSYAHCLRARPARLCIPNCRSRTRNAAYRRQSHDARKLVAHAHLGPQLAVDPFCFYSPLAPRRFHSFSFPLRHEEALASPPITLSTF